jgi:uncharacterized protein YecT (DUF1311 family)
MIDSARYCWRMVGNPKLRAALIGVESPLRSLTRSECKRLFTTIIPYWVKLGIRQNLQILPVRRIAQDPMKTAAIATFLTLALLVTPASSQPRDKCADEKQSNAEMRQCYTKEQTRINAEADSLAREIAAELRKDARDPEMGPVVSDELRKAASSVTRSQTAWRVYRDLHCKAVAHTWTTGSGAGAAEAKCLFQLGQARLGELRSAFNQ